MENLRVNSFRIKLLVLLMSLAMLIGVVFNFNRTAVTNNVNAVSFDDTTSYVSVGELFDTNTKQFDKTNYQILKNYLSGKVDATASDIDNLKSLGGNFGSSLIRQQTLDAGSYNGVDYLAKSNTQDIVVRLGGLDWQVVYLSRDKSDNSILTLWLDNCVQDVWTSRSATEGQNYGFINGGLFGDYNNNWTANGDTTLDYPANMYGTSYLNAVILNNGGMYSINNSQLSNATKSSSSAFALFTMEQYGLTDYLVTPRQVDWQEYQSLNDELERGYDISNEAWAKDVSDDNFGFIENYASKNYSDAWADSYLWIPSLTEVGDGGMDGLWSLSSAQTVNYDGTTENIVSNIGAEGGPVYTYTWLRSTCTYNEDNTTDLASAFGTDGSRTYNCCVYSSLAVRPALHLNLNMVEISVNRASIADGSMSVSPSEEEFNGCEKTPTVAVTIDGEPLVENTDYTLVYTLNGEEVDELWSAGEYTITATGVGNFTGEVSTTFTIEPREIPSSALTIAVSSFEYTGQPVELNPVVVVDGETLVEDRDYAIELVKRTGATGEIVESTIDVSQYFIIARGMGNYTGSSVKEFAIVACDITNATFSTISAQTYTGSAITPTSTVKVDDKTLTAGTDFTYCYSNNTNVGIATITITGTGNYTGTASTTFTIEPLDINDAVYYGSCDSEKVYTGSEIEFFYGLTFFDEYEIKDTDYEVVYTNNINVGTATCTISGINNLCGQIVLNCTITALDISGENITIDDIENQTYTGSEITPLPVIKYNGVKFVKEIDYTLSYSNNTNVTSDAIITVTGKGNFSGTYNYYFQIVPASLDNVQSAIMGNSVYTGSAIVPELQLSYNLQTLSKNKDYTLVYKNSVGSTITEAEIIDAGTYTIIATGVGNFTGERSVTFSIVASDISRGTLTCTSAVYSGSPVFTPTTTLVVDGKTLKLNTDYTIKFYSDGVGISQSIIIDADTYEICATGMGNYTGSKWCNFVVAPLELADGDLTLGEESVEFSNCNIAIDATVDIDGVIIDEDTDYTISYKKDGVVVTKINEAGTYTIIATGMGNYTGTATAEFVVSPLDINSEDISVTLMDNNLEYSGNAIIPAITVEYCGSGLFEGVDYELEYSNNINASKKALITITGKGNFIDNREVYFNIVEADIANAEISAIADQTYTGSAITPAITVIFNGKTLVEDTDYTADYSNNINVSNGEAVVTITGIGNFTGTNMEIFSIKPKSCTGMNFAFPNLQYTGSAVELPTIVVSLDGKTLENGIDYIIKYRKGGVTGDFIDPSLIVEVGYYGVDVVGMGNYVGSHGLRFEVIPLSITDESITVDDIATETYTGSSITPLPVIKHNGITLVKDTDYTLTYSNNTNPGTATITIEGKGNFSGSREINFDIKPIEITIDDININSTEFVYGGLTVYVINSIVIDNVTLEEGFDYYTIIYDMDKFDGSNLEECVIDAAYAVGNYKLVVVGNGNYEVYSPIEIEFEINPLSISDASVFVSTIENQVYTGSEIKPNLMIVFEPHMRGAGGAGLIEGTDYTLTYKDNVNVGEATITITGIGNFTDSREVKFEIEPTSISEGVASLESYDFYYTGNHITDFKESIIVNGKTLVRGEDYSLEIYTESGMGGEYLESVVDVGTYWLVACGENNYCGYLGIGEFAINPLTIESGELTFEDLFTYTGLELIPEVTLTVNGITLEKDRDYLVVASNNIGFGNANLSVTGKGNYTGTINSTFYIAKAALSDVVIDSIPTQNYTGSEITPVPNITYNTRPLSLGVDFECSYDNNINVGTATIIIMGKGNFDGREEVTFEIGSRVISSFTLGTTSFVYDTVEKFPGITVKYGTNILTQDKDYSVVGDISATNVGNYVITITGMGGYSGTKTLRWSITARNLSDCTITFEEEYFVYSGSEHKPNISIVTNVDEYVIGSDNYTLVYSDNIDAGTGKVTITGTGNLTGSLNKTFTIDAKSMLEADVVVAVLGEQVYTGAEIKPELTITYNGMELTKDTDYTCSFNNNIDVTSGARILIVGQGNYTAIKVVEFEIKQRDIAECEVVLSSYNLEYNAEIQVVTVEVKYGETIISSDNYNVIEDSGTDVGEYPIIVYGTNNLKGENSSQTLIISPKQLEETWIGDIPNQLYIHDGNGNAIPVTLDENELVLSCSEFGPLTMGTDFTYEITNATTIYEDETFATPGNIPTVTITGKGNYTGIVSKYFIIYDNNILTDDKATVSIEFNTHTYTGVEIKPQVTVKWINSVLSENTDYRVEYSDNVNVGTATVKVVALGNYNGVVIKTFEITPKSLAGWTEGMMLGGAPYIYNGAEHKPTLTLTTNNGVDLILDTDYSCEYLNNIDAGEATIVVNGKGNYCDSVEIPFRIVPQEITIASIGDLAESSYAYTGSAITPSIVVSYDNGNKVVTLEQDVDYTVSYMNNINVGEATIVATGKGNYSGEITKTFTICSEGLGTVLLDRDSFVYDTTSKTPVFSVKLGDKVLVNGADYDASGDLSASEVGTYTITFTGKGNFSGELTAEWKITARPLEDCYITIVESDLEYTGKEIKPAITIKTAEDGVTISSDMYTLVYRENINVGTGKVVITGKDNLSGTITKTYEISERNINNAYLIIDDDNLIYTSEEIRPTVVVMFNDNTLVEGTDYDVCYENNINAGNEARVIVGGFGNYCGALQKFFTIKPQNISSANLIIDNNTFVYTGSAIDTKAKLVASGVELQKDIDYNVELRLTSPTGNVVDEAKNVGNYYLVVTGTANYTGSKFVGFNIVKATPTVSVVCLDSAIFAGKPVRLGVENSSIEGTVYSSQTSYVEGEFAYEYMFVPVDTDNYNVVVGTITLTATKLQVVGLVFSGDYKTEYVAYETLNTVDLVVSLKYNNNEIQELYLSEYTLSMCNGAILRVGDKVTVTYVNNHEIKADLPITISKREVVASCQQKLIDNGEPQEVILTFDNEVEGVPVTYSAVYYNLSTGMPINNIVNAGKYKAIITLTNENYVIEENEIFFEVCAKTITSSDDALVIESVDGFASDEVLTYDIETNEKVVLEELGISKFKEDKEFVSVYSFDISEDKDVVVTLSLDIDNVESVVVYKLDNNVLVSLPYSVVDGNKISVNCNTADKLYVFKSLTYTINNDKVEFISAIVVLLAIIVVGLLLTMVIEGRNKAKLVNNKSGKSVSTEDIVVEQDNGLKEIQQEVSYEDALLAQYVITDNEGNVVGLKEGAPEELQKAFSELNAEIASENSFASVETISEENAITQENAFVEESAPVEEKPVVEEHSIVEKVEEKQPVLSDEEMIAKYAIIDDNGNVIGVKEDAPEELRQTYSMLVNLKEAENTKKEQQLSDEEMIAKYAIIDENGNVVGLKEDAPEALKQSYNALLNKNDNN